MCSTFVGSDIQIHAQGQMRQFIQERNDKPGRDWNATTVGTSLREWCRAIHHARFGNMSRLSLLVRLDLIGVGLFPLFFVITYVMARLGGDDASSLTKFCHLLLDAGKTGGSADVHPIVGTVLTMPPFFFFGIGMLVAMQSAAPSARFPISRARLARCLFTAAVRQVAIVAAAYLLGIGLSLFAASWIVGSAFELSALSKPLATAAIIPPAIALGFGSYFLRNSFLRYFASAAIGLGTIAAVAAVVVHFSPHVLSPLGLFACAAATAVSIRLSWLAIRRYYLTCDLSRPGDWLRKLGLGIA